MMSDGRDDYWPDSLHSHISDDGDGMKLRHARLSVKEQLTDNVEIVVCCRCGFHLGHNLRHLLCALCHPLPQLRYGDLGHYSLHSVNHTLWCLWKGTDSKPRSNPQFYLPSVLEQYPQYEPRYDLSSSLGHIYLFLPYTSSPERSR